jgi:hypothetical protein
VDLVDRVDFVDELISLDKVTNTETGHCDPPLFIWSSLQVDFDKFLRDAYNFWNGRDIGAP